MRIVFERATCSRCGGTGRMPFAAYGGVCFKCNGDGETLTRAGKAAYKRLKQVQAEVCTVPASAVQPGMKIVGRDGKVRTVTEVKVRLGKGNGVTRIGTPGTDSYSEYETFGETAIYTQKNGYLGAAHRAVTLAWTEETLKVAADRLKKFKGATVE